MEHPLVVFGEVLYDCFEGGSRVLGGAPYNVAWGLHGLGHAPLFISAVGDDEDGASVARAMKEWGMNLDGLQSSESLATGDVQVRLRNGDAEYTISAPRAWDAVEDANVVCTGILYHGLLALRDPRSLRSFEALVERSPEAKRFCDVNLRPPYDALDSVFRWAKDAYFLKLNLDELATLTGFESIAFNEASQVVQQLRNELHIANVLLTAGPEGAMIIGEIGEATCSPAPKPENFIDTVGAGDSFSAYTIHSLIRGSSVGSIVTEASRFASKVCSMKGATCMDADFYSSAQMNL